MVLFGIRWGIFMLQMWFVDWSIFSTRLENVQVNSSFGFGESQNRAFFAIICPMCLSCQSLDALPSVNWLTNCLHLSTEQKTFQSGWMATIKNVVATATMNCNLDLNDIYRRAFQVDYDPIKFSALLIRRFQPFRSHCQCYSNGKVTINGGKSIRESKRLLKRYRNILRTLGYNAVATNYKVVNIIASADLERTINLNHLVANTALRVTFEPELFPGATIKLSDCTAVLFSSGKVNFLGATSEDEIALNCNIFCENKDHQSRTSSLE